MIDLDGKLICWNVGAERIFGYRTDEILGKHYSVFFTPEDNLVGLPEHVLKTSLEDTRAIGNCWQMRKDGSRFWCQSNVTPLLNENQQARSYGGLGIGLALALNLVQMHEGRLQAASEGLGKGCEFSIKLPVLANAKIPQTKTVLEQRKHMGPALQVLIVEDNVDAGDTLSLILRLHGHEVQVARSGPTALAMSLHCLPDVVLLDIGLPEMDGYQVAKQLRARPEFKNVTLCALTGFTPSEADRQRQVETGFDHYYVKPIDLTILLDLFATIEPRAVADRKKKEPEDCSAQ